MKWFKDKIRAPPAQRSALGAAPADDEVPTGTLGTAAIRTAL
jgi:hypothetical protein